MTEWIEKRKREGKENGRRRSLRPTASWTLLRILRRGQGLDKAKLGQRMEMKRATITKFIKTLEMGTKDYRFFDDDSGDDFEDDASTEFDPLEDWG